MVEKILLLIKIFATIAIVIDVCLLLLYGFMHRHYTMVYGSKLYNKLNNGRIYKGYRRSIIRIIISICLLYLVS